MNFKKRVQLIRNYIREPRSLKETRYLLSGNNRDVLLKSLEEAKSGKIIENGLIEE